MDRVYNFSAGPSAMPLEVLEHAQAELANYPGAGCSVLEMSHRSGDFQRIIDEAESSLRKLMAIPDSYAVLFMQGGASLQFSAVPMNLADRGDKVCYGVTGEFAKKAMEEAKRWCSVSVVSDSSADGFCSIPAITADMLPSDAKYLHITGNNTIYGTAYAKLPQCGGIPLVADWSSAILGRDIDVNAHHLIYAGAQKNMGPSGMAVVILRKSLLERETDQLLPSMLSYKIAANSGSMYNTPPCFSIYMAGLVFRWVEKEGGVSEMARRNKEKSGLIYDFLDNSRVFKGLAAPQDRSATNVTFTLGSREATEEFLRMAKGRGMVNLKGHRSIGGCRASIYNGMPMEGAKALLGCMQDFELGKRA